MSFVWRKKRFKCKKKQKKEEESMNKRNLSNLYKTNTREDSILSFITRHSRREQHLCSWVIQKWCQSNRGMDPRILIFAKYSSKLMRNYKMMNSKWLPKFGDQVNWSFINDVLLSLINRVELINWLNLI